YGTMVVFHFLALSMTHTAYMISVKRTSILFSVAYGWLMFRERDIGERLLGSVVMLIGVVLVTV
ncbi:MAG: EamA family transporter, partial [Nitrospirota bacterium]|nr:EamA family transporter [Nitrospirota bacterium]